MVPKRIPTHSYIGRKRKNIDKIPENIVPITCHYYCPPFLDFFFIDLPFFALRFLVFLVDCFFLYTQRTLLLASPLIPFSFVLQRSLPREIVQCGITQKRQSV